MESGILDQFLHYGWIALQVIGATSLVGILGFLTAYYAFPPDLTVEDVRDKSKHNFESRLVVKKIDWGQIKVSGCEVPL